MNETEYRKRLTGSTPKAPEYTVVGGYKGMFPFTDITTKQSHLSYIECYEMQYDEKVHNVVLAYDGDEFHYWCGDAFLEGKITSQEAIKRVDSALAKVVLEKNVITKIKRDCLSNAYGSTANESTGCIFFRSKERTCKHTKQILFMYGARSLETLVDGYNAVMQPIMAMDEDVLMPLNMLKHYAFKKNLQFQGSKGCGKTYMAHEFIDSLGVDKFFLAGHNQIETLDILGHESIKGGDVFWIDGALGAAFRNASKGIKSCLLIDEILRIPSKQLDILVSCLVPDNKGNYLLNTGRFLEVNDGVAVTEVLCAPKELLWVVTTTNVGADYDVENLETALSDRFIICNFPENKELLLNVATEQAKLKKYPQKIVKSLIKFHNTINALVDEGQLNKKSAMRHVCEIIEFSSNKDDIGAEIQRRALNWVDVDMDGEPVQDEIEAVMMAYESAFK
jgi:polyhydroxyalkanoate synthesis regulator phasin